MRTAALDLEQQFVIDQLVRLGTAVLNGTARRGLYLHGTVGRGKTWLCDRFFEQLPVTAKRRVHFHSFFQQLHQSVWDHRTGRDPDVVGDAVDDAIAALLDGVELLYFDEFHVHDSGNAALVHRVLAALFDRDVTLLATSNYAPHALLPGAFHHVFAAGIDLLESNLQIVELEGALDYRRATVAHRGSGFSAGSWLAPGTDAHLALAGLRRPTAAERSVLSAGGHQFTAERADGDQLWFSFAEVCERDTSIPDYLNWMDDFSTWVLDCVPPLSDASTHAVQRFANLVDLLCDRDLTLHIVSAHPPATVMAGLRLPDTARTASRLALLQQPTVVHTQH